MNTYTYNSAYQLIGLSNSSVTTSYAYNGLGDRLRQIINGAPTTYALDINTSLPEVLSDGQSTYIYGLDNIAQTNAQGMQYFLGDALNSTRQLTDASGGVTLSQSYDPFGNVINSTGTGQSVYGYTGEPTDASGLVYLRARYYNPSIGRFLTRDPFSGYLDLPQSQNPYSYAINNPVRYTDPSGKCFSGMVIDTVVCAAVAGAVIDLAVQLYHNGGNFDCIDWSEVGVAFGAGAVAGLVGFYAFATFLPTTIATATLSDFVIAGGLSSIVAGQAARSSALLFSGHANQIISSFAQPSDVLTDFAIGVVFGGIGYGVKGLIEAYRDAMSISIGVPDEMLNPSMGHDGYYSEYQPISTNVGGSSNEIVRYDPEFAATQINQGTAYYVRPNGEVIPATGYRYISNKVPYLSELTSTKLIPANPDPLGTYISLTEFKSPAAGSLQTPFQNSASIKLTFDTLQIIDDVRIPYGNNGNAPWLEPLTIDFPEYGPGGATQAITNQQITIKEIISLLIK